MASTLISYTPPSLIYGIAGAATGLTAVLIIVHIVSRRVARASVWLDDSLLWFGGALSLVMNALFIYGKLHNVSNAAYSILILNEQVHISALVNMKTKYQHLNSRTSSRFSSPTTCYIYGQWLASRPHYSSSSIACSPALTKPCDGLSVSHFASSSFGLSHSLWSQCSSARQFPSSGMPVHLVTA